MRLRMNPKTVTSPLGIRDSCACAVEINQTKRSGLTLRQVLLAEGLRQGGQFSFVSYSRNIAPSRDLYHIIGIFLESLDIFKNSEKEATV